MGECKGHVIHFVRRGYMAFCGRMASVCIYLSDQVLSPGNEFQSGGTK